jgi:hypothetical protein
VSEAHRDEKLMMTLVVENVSLPSAESGRTSSEIDGEIEDPSASAAHQFGLAGTV